MNRTRVLFVYTSMVIGGSTTSLLGLLRGLDYGRIDVDLLLLDSDGPLVHEIPEGVRVIRPFEWAEPVYLGPRSRFFSPRYVWMWTRGWLVGAFSRRPLLRSQILARELARFYADVPGEYDVAVAFLELFPAAYAAHRVNARRKIAWLHADYRDAGLRAGVESSTLGKFHHLVFVSDATRLNFCYLYPELASRCLVIPNPVSPDAVRRKGEMELKGALIPDPRSIELNLVSNSRIDFASKGHDRALAAFKQAVLDVPSSRAHWWIVGDGPDLPALRRLVADQGLESRVTLLGSLQNPFPVLRLMDVFFMPSIYEGKPMAVTEAQVLGLPVLATRYASATEQVQHGVDGLVVDNSFEGIREGLSLLLDDQSLVSILRTGCGRRPNPVDKIAQRVTELLTGESVDAAGGR